MNALINQLIRMGLSLLFTLAEKLIRAQQYLLRKDFKKQQRLFLKRKSLVGLEVRDFSGQTDSLAQVYASMNEPKGWAYTSGTRKEPKAIPFDVKRTKLLQKTFLKSMVTLTAPYPGIKTFFVFASLNEDNSLTASMIANFRQPNRIELLQAPYRYLQTARGQELRAVVGDLTARVILLILTQPRFLYATNPSTLTHFLSEVTNRSPEIKKGIEQLLNDANRLNELLKLTDGDGPSRLKQFSASPELDKLLPKLKAVITWDGGYVSPFLNQLRLLLPKTDFIPMYSMSTETVETIPHRIKGRLHFLPTAYGCYPEFLPANSDNLLPPQQLKVGQSYSLVMSDIWGLTRYDTQDIFLVKGMVDGLPDLAFQKRRGVNSSLTGEKLTEDHILELIQELKKQRPDLGQTFFSLFPIKSGEQIGYQLALVGGSAIDNLQGLGKMADHMLGVINTEYHSKISSGRLAPMLAASFTAAELAELMGKSGHWESQFKILPLYDKIISKNN